MGVISLHSDLSLARLRQVTTFVPSLLQYDGGLSDFEGEGQDAGGRRLALRVEMKSAMRTRSTRA